MLSRRRFLRGVSSGMVTTGAALAARPAAARGQVIAPTLTAADLKPAVALDEAYWWKVRSQFNILDGMTFMNNGTEGPVSRCVTAANEKFFREIAENPSNNYIEARVRFLSTRLRGGLKTIPGVKLWTSEAPKFAAGLTLFSVRDIPMANVQQAILNRDRIYIRTMTTGNLNAVRAATHIYNMPAEVEHLIASVKHVAENASRYMTATAERGSAVE